MRFPANTAISLFIVAAAASGLAAPTNQEQWKLDHEKDFNDNITLVAKFQTPTSYGGTIYATAKCSARYITIDFEYHAKSEEYSYYDTTLAKDTIRLPYRINSASELIAIIRPEHRNVASIRIGHPAPFDRELPLSINQMNALYEPIDIDKFLPAQLVRFELPLGGGLKSVVSIKPQDGSFLRFLSECGIGEAVPGAGTRFTKYAMEIREKDKTTPTGPWHYTLRKQKETNSYLYSFGRLPDGTYRIWSSIDVGMPMPGVGKTFKNKAEFLQAVDEFEKRGTDALDAMMEKN
jgi:hypothetical protein